jgi:LPXTG-motif cell wall-anchored protein
MQRTGNSIIVRTPDGIRMFSEGDVEKRNVQIYRDGQPIRLTDLNTNDRLTATIVTEKPPKVMTQREVAATLSGAPAPAPAPASTSGTAAPAAPAPPAPAPSTGTAAPAPRKKLPKTASNVPLIGLVGIASLFVGVTLTARRRSRSV